MAISKTQNERPAIVALIDAVNAMGDVNGQFATLTQSLGATNQQVLLLTGVVDGMTEDVNSLNTDMPIAKAQISNLQGRVEALEIGLSDFSAFIGDFRIGETSTITVPANDSYASAETFTIPFGADDDCVVMLQVITGELPTLFNVDLIDCTYSGFSYQITNSDADPHDVKLGYVATRTSRV